jgi:hypothetical protein
LEDLSETKFLKERLDRVDSQITLGLLETRAMED